MYKFNVGYCTRVNVRVLRTKTEQLLPHLRALKRRQDCLYFTSIHFQAPPFRIPNFAPFLSATRPRVTSSNVDVSPSESAPSRWRPFADYSDSSKNQLANPMPGLRRKTHRSEPSQLTPSLSMVMIASGRATPAGSPPTSVLLARQQLYLAPPERSTLGRAS